MDYVDNLILSDNIFTFHLSKEEEIKNIIRDHWIIMDDFTVNEDGTVTVDGNVTFPPIMNYHEKLPLKFKEITGNLDISNLRLKTLYGCPTEVGGDFNCSYNQLKSLKFAPTKIGGNVLFYCDSGSIPPTLFSYSQYIKTILKYQDYFEIWSEIGDMLIEHKFDVLIEEILDGLE